MGYERFKVTYANGVTREFHETAKDVRETARFYSPSFGVIRKVEKVKDGKLVPVKA